MLVEVVGATGFDFVMFDAEHSGNAARAMEDLVRTATVAGRALAEGVQGVSDRPRPPVPESGFPD